MRLTAVLIITLALLAGLIPSRALAQHMVLFDQGHGQPFTAGQSEPLGLSGLADIFREAGYATATESGPLSATRLAHIDVLIVSGAMYPFSANEIEVVTDFLARGGSLCTMLHIASPMAPLLGRLGVVASNGVLHEPDGNIEGNDLSFRITRLAPHPLFMGIEQFNLYGGWALLADGPGVANIALTSPAAWINLNGKRTRDAADTIIQQFAVAVTGTYGRGRFVVFGDDAIFQNKFLTEGNLALGRKLAAWLPAPSTSTP